jgi:hypothetical protein
MEGVYVHHYSQYIINVHYNKMDARAFGVIWLLPN